VGQRISLDGKNWITIAGIAGDVKEFGLGEQAPDQVYVPMAAVPNVGSILVRAMGEPNHLATEIRQAILAVDPQTAINRLQSLDQVRSDSVSSPRTVADLFGMFSGLALVIAVTGLASMLALMVRQRTREIAIRMSLGASTSGVSRMVVGRGLLLVSAGLIAGLMGSLGLTRFLSSLLFETSPTDSLTFLTITAVLLGTALLAAYIPARRAAGIDPQIALRSE
jgi:putative ABC transport system permease protein